MFAIASDNVEQVRSVLESGEANPNESVGPQAALAFALSNENLSNKLEIVKTLLAFGADPNVVKDEQQTAEGETSGEEAPPKNTLDPATK